MKIQPFVQHAINAICGAPQAQPAVKPYLQQIAKMLREQGERENTYEKQDCFERAAQMVEGL